ncbi:MAG: hypothetical protein U1E17_02920 [Geminicoccaceae bacterium]
MPEIMTSPGSARACRRAAMLTPSPQRSSPDHDVAEIDADAELERRLGQEAAIAGTQPLLRLDRALHGLDHAREVGDQPIAPGVDHARYGA